MWLDWTWQRQINLIWVAAVGQRAKQLWDLVLSPPWSWECSPTEPLLSLKKAHILGPEPRPIINRLRFWSTWGPLAFSALVTPPFDGRWPCAHLFHVVLVHFIFQMFLVIDWRSGLMRWVQKQRYRETVAIMKIAWTCQYFYSDVYFILCMRW